MSAVTLNLHKTCRCCLRFGDSLGVQSIFNVKTDFAVSPLEQLRVCADVHVRADEDLPKGICNRCLVDLINAHQFRSRCLKTGELLAKMGLTVSPIEPEEPEETPSTPFTHDHLDRLICDDQVILSTAFLDEPKFPISLKSKTIQKTKIMPNIGERKMEIFKSIKSEIFEPRSGSLENNLESSPQRSEFESSSQSHKLESSLECNNFEYSNLESPPQCDYLESSPQSSDVEFSPKRINLESSPQYNNMKYSNVDSEEIFHRCKVKYGNSELKSANNEPETINKSNNVQNADSENEVKDSPSIIECEICHEEFATSDERNQHMENEHQSSTEDIVSKKPKLKINLQTHNCICKICQFMFLYRTSVRKHFGNCHTDLKRDSYDLHIGFKRIDMPNTDKIACGNCEMDFPSYVMLKKHFQRVHNSVIQSNREFRCSQCPFVSKMNSGLVRHMNKHAGKNFECENCDKSFQYSTSLVRHYQRGMCKGFGKNPLETSKVTPKVTPKEPYCNKCNIKFESTKKLREHRQKEHVKIKNKTGRAPPKYRTCQNCNVTFESRLKLKEHKKDCKVSRKKARKEYYCQICNMKFESKVRRNSHKIEQHLELATVENSIVLDNCAITVVNNESNQDSPGYMQMVTMFMCSICQKDMYAKTTQLKHHIFKAHRDFSGFIFDNRIGKQIYKCRMCPYESENKHKQYSHSLRHVWSRVRCEICGKIYANKQTLNSHVKQVHHRISRYANGKVHPCPMCKVRFADKKSLNEHKSNLDIHTLLTCNWCYYTTYKRMQLKKHIMKHHPGHWQGTLAKVPKPKPKVEVKRVIRKSYRCPTCGEGFIRSNTLEKHMSECNMRHLFILQ